MLTWAHLRPHSGMNGPRSGSISTATPSAMSSGTTCSWERWTSISVDQPPPVSAQQPVCSPGLR